MFAFLGDIFQYKWHFMTGYYEANGEQTKKKKSIRVHLHICISCYYRRTTEEAKINKVLFCWVPTFGGDP